MFFTEFTAHFLLRGMLSVVMSKVVCLSVTQDCHVLLSLYKLFIKELMGMGWDMKDLEVGLFFFFNGTRA
jgi:hypothetical protein